MKTKKVISSKNLPSKSPVLGTVVYVLAMDYWNAPQWLWGAVGLILIVIWASWIVSFFQEKEVDLFDEKTSQDMVKKNPLKFEKKMREMLEKAEKQ